MNPVFRSNDDLYPALMPHPIQDSAPRPARGLSLGISLLLSSLILSMLSFLQLEGHAGNWLSGIQAAKYRTVAVRLSEWVSAPPVETLIPSPAPKEGKGEGHTLGTGTIDPALAAQSQSAKAIASESETGLLGSQGSSAGPGGPVDLNLRLPVAAGGNGLAKGQGTDNSAGLRSAEGAHLPDFRLVLIHHEVLTHQLVSGENLTGKTVRVRITIGSDGVPASAEALAGPPELFSEAVQTALKYRFEPLAPHGLKAPYEINVNFLAVLKN